MRSLLQRLKSLRQANEISSLTQALAEHVPAVVGFDVWLQACEGIPKNWDAIAAALRRAAQLTWQRPGATPRALAERAAPIKVSTTQAAVPSVPPPPVASAEQAAPPAPPPAEPGSRDLFDESSDEEDATCAICLEPLGDAPRMPGCAHRFHAACVLGPDSLASHAWADGVMPSTRRGQRVLCPLCRAPSLIPPGFL